MNRMETKQLTDNELIAEFMGNDVYDYELFSGNVVRVFVDSRVTDSVTRALSCRYINELKYDSSWDILMPVMTLLLNKLRLENWSTREASEWAEVHRKHVERRLFDYIYDDNTSQYDLVAEISSAIRWYNSNKQVANVVEECLQECKNQPQKAS